MVKRSKSAKRRRSTKKKTTGKSSASKLGSSSSYKFKLLDIYIMALADIESKTTNFLFSNTNYGGIRIQYNVAKFLESGDFVSGLRAQASLW